ncbi:AfsA-related hotdog domain-containing protein [Streptomyces globisporus]|uniref:AfsA-related hotdog domain-containing protein n=1 Tax=Streptomyces globisporus TaxID=1908 RepID=UPI0004CBA360|nr:AfsA-related hotdog domain-containing protein [Streptomyces globisporus]
MTDAVTARRAAPHTRGTGAALFGTTRHLIHCPLSWDRCLDAPGVGEEHFVIADHFPEEHPLFNDGPCSFHDVQVVTEAVREIGEFVGHRYFGVPPERPGLFHAYGLDLTDLSAWRTGPAGGGRLTTRLRATPVHVINGVPRGLTFHVEVSIEGRRCATGSAGVVFLAPALYRNQLGYARPGTIPAPEDGEAPHRPVTPADAASVGRRAPENVLVGDVEQLSAGRLSTRILTEGIGPVFAGADGRLPGLHLLESLRQTALLAAGRCHGLVAERSTLAASRVQFRGSAAAGPPLRCVAVPGSLERDPAGRPSLPVTLTLTQNRKAVAEARTVVVQDL